MGLSQAGCSFVFVLKLRENSVLMSGDNETDYGEAPDLAGMNLCDVHYHRNAEHKANDYFDFIDTGDDHAGYACTGFIPPDPNADRGDVGVVEGDTVEIHWVYTNCDTTSNGVVLNGTGLNACLTNTCANPRLTVVSQVFVAEERGEVRSLDSPMQHDDLRVSYTGSTTGPTYSNDHCSSLQVFWDVKTTCHYSLDLRALERFARQKGEHAHGVRELVIDPALLSPIEM